MTGPFTWEQIYALIFFASGVLAIWWRIEKRIEKAETASQKQNEARGDEIIILQKDLSDYKLDATSRFASHQLVKDVEVRLTASIDRLTDRIEQLPSKFAEEVSRMIERR